MTETLAVEAERYLDHLTVERGLSAHTLAAYRRDLRRYVGFLGTGGSTDPSQVDESSIRSFVASVSASTHGDDERPYRATSRRTHARRRCVRSTGSCSGRGSRTGTRRPASPSRKLPAPAPAPAHGRRDAAPPRGARPCDPRRPPRPRDPRAAVRLGPADLRAHRRSTSTTWTWRRAPSGCSAREGRSARCPSGGSRGRRWTRTSPADARRSPPRRAAGRCS